MELDLVAVAAGGSGKSQKVSKNAKK